MTGLSICDLAPVPGFRLGQVSGKGRTCETAADARSEDVRRVELLRLSAGQAKISANRDAAGELADLLDYGDGDPPQTTASKLYMRSVRERLLGHLSTFLANSAASIATVHLEPLRQELPGSCLGDLNPRNESDILRAALREKGIADLEGAAILFQDVEHEARTDVWRGGRHGIVIGEKVEAFNALRKTRNYEPRLQASNHRRTPRVRIIRSITNLEYHLSYLLKGSIYGRWEGTIEGKRVRSRKRRVPGHRHSQALLWLHSHPVNDLCQLIGMRVGSDGFFFTNGTPKAEVRTFLDCP